MEKKIFDILPPKIEKKVIKEPKSRLKKPEIKISLPSFKKKLIFFTLALILIGIFYYFTLTKAEINLWPKTEILTFETDLTVDKRAQAVNMPNQVIPGEIFETEMVLSQEFPATGKKLVERKAEGIIRVYNNYHSPQALVKNTRFQPPLEKFQPSLTKNERPWFLTLERITIPSKSYKDVKVAAQSPGEKYNIESSIFSIPGLAGTPRYTFIYGKSFQKFEGGLKKEVPQVREEDLEKAKDFLTKKIKEEIKTSLKNKIPPDFISFEEAFKTEILETFSSGQAGMELEKFIFQVKAKSRTLVFKKEDLKNFTKEFILFNLSEGKLFHQESLRMNYFPQNIDLKLDKITLTLNSEGKIYSAIDEDNLKRALAGRSLAEAKIFLKNQPEILQAEIKLWPPWLKKITEEEKITINLRVDPVPNLQ